MERTITLNEFESALSAIKNILETSVEISDMGNNIPLISDVSDSNKVIRGKLSILFVDIRKSSELTEDVKAKNMVKVYRSFIRTAIQSIRYCGGVTRQFAGDGIMGVFFDDDTENSSIKAVQAARYLITMIDFCLNPVIKNVLPNALIGCGIGITTGQILITKVGMRGKEGNEAAENETSLVWTGEPTNLASRLCGLAKAREIFIDESTFQALDKNDIWVLTERTKGTAIYGGYIASEFYLPFAEEVNANATKADSNSASSTSFVQELFSESKTEILCLVDEISKKSTELSTALENVKKREQQIAERERQVAVRENQAHQKENRLDVLQSQLEDERDSVDSKDKENKNEEYDLHKGLFKIVFCKEAIIKQLGKDYWIKLINKMMVLGATIGKNNVQVKADLAYDLVYIYYYFEMYKEAYDAICLQAQHTNAVAIYILEDIVKKTGNWSTLKRILEERVKNSHMDTHIAALNKIKSMGY